MKVNELKIGDWVYNTNNRQPEQVCEIREHMVMLDYNDLYDYVEIEPIPLSAEILEQNGLEKKDHRYGIYDDYSDFEIYEYNDGTWLVSYHCCEMSLSDEQLLICYVHQLQHFVRHCGIEKEIEL